MGYGVLVIGESGAGKSTSLRNFGPDELALVNVNGKPMPFRGRFTNQLRSDDYNSITQFIKAQAQAVKAIAIDDCQYLLANEFMRKCRENGYQKFTDMAEKFWKLIKLVDMLPDDVIVYFLGHTTTDDTGRVRFKTIGKMLDEKITVEGMFTTVLHAAAVDGQYYFATQSRGDTAKSPIGLFPDYLIPNDLKMVDDLLRIYYGFAPEHHCTDCNTVIIPKPGHSVDELIDATMSQFGKKLCTDCAKRAYDEANKE